MGTNSKIKRRGFVMTGGGAKGLYEAGVIHAFHIVGMEFDVITGSSIGAFNSIFFAEYLLRKRALPPDTRSDPKSALDAMDSMVKAYHHAWLQLPEKRIIDDGEDGPLGKLKDDLVAFDLSLPDLTRIFWWWTDPDRGKIPAVSVWSSLAKLANELKERLGGAGVVLKIIKENRTAPFQQAIRTYLARFGMERSLVPPADDGKLSSVFTSPIEPLQPEHLQSGGKKPEGREKVALVAAGRTLRDFAKTGVDVRLTRANYRTGRLEISAYMSPENFVRYLGKQAFRLQKTDPAKIPLGSFRLQLPGNPDAIAAALASGRFPGVLAPYPVENIYPPTDPENVLLHRMLANWLDDPEVEANLTAAYLAQHPGDNRAASRWQKTYDEWRSSAAMRNFFPQQADLYVDGGAIDNTPSNSVIDATREWVEASGKSKRDVVLDLYVIFLHPEPAVEPAEVKDPAFHQVLQRTLEIQGAAKQSSDAVVVDTINTFGKRAENLGDGLTILLEALKEHLDTVDPVQRKVVLDSLGERFQGSDLPDYLGKSGDAILDRLGAWSERLIQQQLPIQVNEVVIYPDEMPMSTLQFTERLGYSQENALNMLTMGCYHTLWAILTHLEGDPHSLDALDGQALTLAKTWTGIDSLPEDPVEKEELRRSWRCKRTDCVFHPGICPRST